MKRATAPSGEPIRSKSIIAIGSVPPAMTPGEGKTIGLTAASGELESDKRGNGRWVIISKEVAYRI